MFFRRLRNLEAFDFKSITFGHPLSFIGTASLVSVVQGSFKLNDRLLTNCVRRNEKFKHFSTENGHIYTRPLHYFHERIDVHLNLLCMTNAPSHFIPEQKCISVGRRTNEKKTAPSNASQDYRRAGSIIVKSTTREPKKIVLNNAT